MKTNQKRGHWELPLFALSWCALYLANAADQRIVGAFFVCLFLAVSVIGFKFHALRSEAIIAAALGIIGGLSREEAFSANVRGDPLEVKTVAALATFWFALDLWSAKAQPRSRILWISLGASAGVIIGVCEAIAGHKELSQKHHGSVVGLLAIASCIFWGVLAAFISKALLRMYDARSASRPGDP